MNNNLFIQTALGDITPWYVVKVELKTVENNQKQLEVYLDFKEGSVFKDEAGVKCKAYDTQEHQWRHLNFFEHRCYIHARVPRIVSSDGKIKKITVPWARRNGGFTLLMESFMMTLIELEVNVSAIARLVKEYGQRVWEVFNYWVEKAKQEQTLSAITQIGIDETSRKKGHEYITVGVDLEKKKVFHVVLGKDSQSVAQLGTFLQSKGSPPEQVSEVCIDMSPAFISGTMETFPNAQITFDYFHVSKEVNKALDELRRLERIEYGMTKTIRFSLLKNPDKLKSEKLQQLHDTFKAYPTLGEGYRLKEYFRELWNFTDVQEATLFLEQWCKEAMASGIQPFKRVVKMLKAHWSGIIHHAQSQITNGILEGINSKIQLAKKRARGYSNTSNFINMIYFLCGNLKFSYPQVFI